MKQVKMTFPDYPMLCYFLNMLNYPGMAQYTLSLDGPTKGEVTVEMHFTDKETEANLDALHKMFAAAGGYNFSVAELFEAMGSQVVAL